MEIPKITFFDYFRMPFFAGNWLSFVMILFPLLLLKYTVFKKYKFSIVLFAMAVDVIILFCMPVQSYLSLKLWWLNDNQVLYGVFPLSAFIISTLVSYLSYKLNLKIRAMWPTKLKKPHIKAFP